MLTAVRTALVLGLAAWSTAAHAGMSDDELATLLARSLDRAEALVDDGEIAEGLYVGSVVASLYPSDPRVQTLLQTGYDAKVRSKALGYNVGRRVRRDKASAGRRILFYLPDRVLDVLDLLTLRLSVGPQIGFRAHATHLVQANAYAGTTVGAGIGQKHFAGVDAETRVDVALGPIGPKVVGGFRLGTNVDAAGGVSVVQLPTNQLYDNYRDYWAIGGAAGLLIVGAEAEVHPFEVGDFLAGLVGADPLRDDLASTQRLRLRDGDGALYGKLANRVRRGRLRRFLDAHPALPASGGAPD